MILLRYRSVHESRGDCVRLAASYREVWRRKAIIREVYAGYYRTAAAFLTEGRTVAVGDGIGTFEEFFPTAIFSDIVPAAWLDVAADGTALPFRDASVANLVLFDVLHHLPDLSPVLGEAWRALRGGGRLILQEPFASPLARAVKRVVGHEVEEGSTPYSSHERFGYWMRRVFERGTASDMFLAPWQLVHQRLVLGFAHVLSGGFNYRSLIPFCGYSVMKAVEMVLMPWASQLAFYGLLVLEKPSR